MGSKLQIKTKFEKGNDSDEDYQPMSPTSQYLSSEYMSLAIIVVFEFEVPIDDFNSTMEVFKNIAQSNPRFSSIMEDDEKGEKHWKSVEVNIDDHLFFPNFPTNMTCKEYDNILDEYLTKISIDPLPQDKPLWQFHIVKYPTSNSAGSLIFKLSHAIGDGYSIMGLILSCFQRADNPSLSLTFPTIRRNSRAKCTTSFKSILSTIKSTSQDFTWTLWKSMIGDDKTPIRSGNEVHKAVKISTIAFSLDQVKEIKTRLGVTINDVLTGIIQLGARLYMQEGGKEYRNFESTLLGMLNSRDVNAYASIQEMQKPNSKAEWGNKIIFWYIPIPAFTNETTSDPLDFVFKAQSLIKRKQDRMFVDLIIQTGEILRRFAGLKVASKYVHSCVKNTSVGFSNVIGPTEKLAIANHPIKGMYFMVTGVPLSIFVTVTSYEKILRIGVGVEEGFVDVEKYCSCIHNAYNMIYKAAMEKPLLM